MSARAHQPVRAAVAAAAMAAFATLGTTAIGPARAAEAQAVAVPQSCSRNWVGKEAEIEAFLKSARVLRLEAVPIGVTRPQRAVLEPGGLVERFAWKALPPAMKSGYRESYKAEKSIALGGSGLLFGIIWLLASGNARD